MALVVGPPAQQGGVAGASTAGNRDQPGRVSYTRPCGRPARVSNASTQLMLQKHFAL
jgi:hypothetical protein